MEEHLIEILRKHCTSPEKDYIINYLIKRKRFYELMNLDTSLFNDELIQELLCLAKDLNALKQKFKNKSTKDLYEYFYAVGILTILNMSYIKENYRDFIIEQEYTKINNKAIKNVFKITYQKYKLINNVYEENGELGLTKYILINRDLIKEKDKTLFDLFNNKVISKNEIIYLTSTESTFNNGKCYNIGNKLLKTKILEKKKMFFENKSEIIYI